MENEFFTIVNWSIALLQVFCYAIWKYKNSDLRWIYIWNNTLLNFYDFMMIQKKDVHSSFDIGKVEKKKIKEERLGFYA